MGHRDSINERLWDEAEALLTEDATTDLIGATLRGDRRGMRDALDMLVTLVTGAERRELLITFVRHLIAVAGSFRGAPPAELAAAMDIVEQLPVEALEAYAHKFAWLAYAAGSTAPALTMN
jgi:hypothetical protein